MIATVAGWLSWWWLPCELASHFRVQYLWIAFVCALALAASTTLARCGAGRRAGRSESCR